MALFSQLSCRPLVGIPESQLAPCIAVTDHSSSLSEYLPMSEDVTQALGKVAVCKGITNASALNKSLIFNIKTQRGMKTTRGSWETL